MIGAWLESRGICDRQLWRFRPVPSQQGYVIRIDKPLMEGFDIARVRRRHFSTPRGTPRPDMRLRGWAGGLSEEAYPTPARLETAWLGRLRPDTFTRHVGQPLALRECGRRNTVRH
jgi:hypothetical protein